MYFRPDLKASKTKRENKPESEISKQQLALDVRQRGTDAGIWKSAGLHENGLNKAHLLTSGLRKPLLCNVNTEHPKMKLWHIMISKFLFT